MPSDSWDERFGPILRSQGVAAIPSTLFHYQKQLDMTAQETWLICALLSYKWDKREPYPSIARIARQSGIPRPTVMAYLKQLQNKGLILVHERHAENGRRTSSSYSFDPLWERLERFILAGDSDTSAVLSAHVTVPRQPVDSVCHMTGQHEEDTRETETEEQESRVALYLYHLLNACKPDDRAEVRARLAELGNPERLARAIARVEMEWDKQQGRAEFWRRVEWWMENGG